MFCFRQRSKVSKGKTSLKLSLSIKLFCSTSDKIAVLVDSTVPWLFEFMLVIKIKSLGKAVKRECERFPKATLPMKLPDNNFRVLLCESKVVYLGGQMHKGKDWVTFGKGKEAAAVKQRIKENKNKLKDERFKLPREKWGVLHYYRTCKQPTGTFKARISVPLIRWQESHIR